MKTRYENALDIARSYGLEGAEAERFARYIFAKMITGGATIGRKNGKLVVEKRGGRMFINPNQVTSYICSKGKKHKSAKACWKCYIRTGTKHYAQLATGETLEIGFYYDGETVTIFHAH